MSIQNIKTIDRFHANLISLADFMVEIIPDGYEGINVGILDLKKTYLDGWNEEEKEKAIESFINNTYKSWDALTNKINYTFIAKNSLKIFSYFGDHAYIFPKLFSDEKTLKKNDIELIWKYIISFIKQGIRYIHEKRNPTHKLIKGRYLPVYVNKYMDHVDVIRQAKTWEISLEWPTKV